MISGGAFLCGFLRDLLFYETLTSPLAGPVLVTMDDRRLTIAPSSTVDRPSSEPESNLC